MKNILKPKESRTDADRYREMSKYSQIGWWESDVEAQVYKFSENICKILELKGNTMPFSDLLSHVREDYRALIKQEFAEFSNYRRKFYTRTFPLNTKQGEIWFKVTLCYDLESRNAGHGTFGTVEVMPEENTKNLTTVPDEHTVNFLGHMFDNVTKSLVDFLSTKDEDTIVDNILKNILGFYEASAAFVFEFTPDGTRQYCTHEILIDKAPSIKQYYGDLEDFEVPWITSNMLANHPLIIDSVYKLPQEAELEYKKFITLGIKSIILVPLIGYEKVWGYIGLYTREKYRLWNNEDYMWLLSIGSILGVCTALNRERKENESGQLYKANLINYMPIGYGRLKLIFSNEGNVVDYRVLEANKSASAFFGFAGENIGHLGSELHDQKFLVDKITFLQKVFDTKTYVEKDDSLSSGMSCHKIAYASGNNEVVEFMLDTTERQKAFAEAKRSDKLFKDIFYNIPIGEAIYDTSGAMTNVNNAFLEIFGMSSKEDAKGYLFLEDKNMSQNLFERIQKEDNFAFSLKYSFDKVDNYRTRRQGESNLFFKLIKLYDEEHLIGFLLICMEESDRIVAMSRVHDFENFFSLISDYAKVGYAKINLMTNEGYAIKQWCRNMGENGDTPLHEIVGIYSKMHPEDKQDLMIFYDKVRRGEATDFEKEVRIQRPGTKDKWNWIYKNLLVTNYAPNQGKIELIGVNYDITKFKDIEEELTRAKDKAEEMDKLKSAFLANMSHEIRTPLNAIVGFSGLLVDTEDKNERQQYMTILQENNDLLLQLINDILDLSKMEAGMMDFNCDEVNVNNLCEDIVKSMRLKVKNKVEIIFNPTLPSCTIYTDRNRLNQVISNFINNSIKFTDNGTIKLEYELVDKQHIRFLVTDTGVGIDEEQLPTVFERFVKLDRFVHGTGLGLSICRNIVEQLGGIIGVESKKGEGSCFWFVLPTIQDNGKEISKIQTNDIKENNKTNINMDTNLNDKPVVLIAEDEESNYFLLKSILKNDYTVYHAADGLEAVKQYENLRPDIILMDLQMPNLDGLEATKLIRKKDKQVPIFAVTAFAFDKDKTKAMEAGCNDFITKPVKISMLKEKIAAALKQ